MTCLVASPNSKWIATASKDGTIIIWDAEHGTIMLEWIAHWGPVGNITFSPDGRRLVSSMFWGDSDDSTLIVWDISRNVSKIAVLAIVDKTGVTASAWSPDGTLIASAYDNAIIVIWDAVTFQQRYLLTIDVQSQPYSLRWSSDSHYLACAHTYHNRTDLRRWTAWSPPTGEPPKGFTFHQTSCEVWSFDRDGRRIAIAVSIRPADLNYWMPEGVSVGDGIQSSDGRSRLYSRIEIWDVVRGVPLVILRNAKEIHAISFSPDGRSLLSISKDGLMKVWDTQTTHETGSLAGDGGRFPTACFSPDGKYIAAASNKERTGTFTVRLWRVGEALCATVFREHKDRISHLAFSSNGQFLASGDWSGIVHIRCLSDFARH